MAKNKLSIEKSLCPDCDILKTDEGLAFAKILDAELDILECEFDYSESVIINTEGYSHITLNLNNLKTLKRLILESEKFYENEIPIEDDKKN